jgi:hypothetical protein
MTGEKRAPANGGLANLRLVVAYRIVALLATIFGWPFWLSEQWRGRVADRIDNERSEM